MKWVKHNFTWHLVERETTADDFERPSPRRRAPWKTVCGALAAGRQFDEPADADKCCTDCTAP